MLWVYIMLIVLLAIVISGPGLFVWLLQHLRQPDRHGAATREPPDLDL